MQAGWIIEVVSASKGEEGKIQAVDLYVAEIPARLCSAALQVPNEFLKNQYPHLKLVGRGPQKGLEAEQQGTREKSVLLLVGKRDRRILAELERILLESGIASSLTLKKVSVPATAPRVPEEYLEWRSLWPLASRNPVNQKDGFHDTESLKQIIESSMRMVLDSATEPWCCASNCVISYGRRVVSKAILSNSPGNAARNSGTGFHPLYFKHAPFIALQRLAALVLRSVASSEFPSEEAFDRVSLDQQCTERKITCLDSVFKRDSEPKLEFQYYATKCIAYCSAEPCVMCCMALLHSRIYAVVWNESKGNPYFSSFTSDLRLQSNPLLNHRFRTFKTKF